jgi:hypothetical protein
MPERRRAPSSRSLTRAAPRPRPQALGDGRQGDGARPGAGLGRRPGTAPAGRSRLQAEAACGRSPSPPRKECSPHSRVARPVPPRSSGPGPPGRRVSDARSQELNDQFDGSQSLPWFRPSTPGLRPRRRGRGPRRGSLPGFKPGGEVGGQGGEDLFEGTDEGGALPATGMQGQAQAPGRWADEGQAGAVVAGGVGAALGPNLQWVALECPGEGMSLLGPARPAVAGPWSP